MLNVENSILNFESNLSLEYIYYKKVFIIRGIGYRFSFIKLLTPDNEFKFFNYLLIRVGHSYSTYIPIPNYVGIRIVKKDRKLVVYGFDKSLVITISNLIYCFRKPSVYTGRGIRAKGIYVRRKAGKKDVRKGRFF